MFVQSFMTSLLVVRKLLKGWGKGGGRVAESAPRFLPSKKAIPIRVKTFGKHIGIFETLLRNLVGVLKHSGKM